METKLTVDIRRQDTPYIIYPQKVEKCPPARMCSPGFQWRTVGLSLDLFDIDLTGIDLAPSARYLISDGWVQMSRVINLAVSHAPCETLKGRYSNMVGLFIAFRHLMSGHQRISVGATFCLDTGSGLKLALQHDSIPGYMGAMYVPARWARQVIRYIERGVVRVWIDQNSPPRLMVEWLNGKYKYLIPKDPTVDWGWSIEEGSGIQLMRSQEKQLL
ncbi:MAG: hypothetical protein FGM57_02005 [Candidatus Taylorbacteria bacterium]|nr:hypothetical protein [Candidatus Taylorbacteria bacterium]